MAVSPNIARCGMTTYRFEITKTSFKGLDFFIFYFPSFLFNTKFFRWIKLSILAFSWNFRHITTFVYIYITVTQLQVCKCIAKQHKCNNKKISRNEVEGSSSSFISAASLNNTILDRWPVQSLQRRRDVCSLVETQYQACSRILYSLLWGQVTTGLLSSTVYCHCSFYHIRNTTTNMFLI